MPKLGESTEIANELIVYDFYQIRSAALTTADLDGDDKAEVVSFDGVARPQGMAVDIGAYEWQGRYQYLPLVSR